MSILTTKQSDVLYSYLHDDWKMLILAGAKRSGKTYLNNFIFLLELRRVAKLAKKNKDPHPQVILAGFSSNTIYNNVIAAIENQFGISLKADRHGHYSLWGVDIVPSYTGNLKGMSSIRGMTAYFAYVNEASLAVKEVFQEILSRCSVEGSRVICDTNPDNPQHWLKVDYIDNHDPKARIKTFSFTIDDNTVLSQDYVQSFKAQTPKGVFYDRDILGLWAMGEGLVYSDFDKVVMMVDESELPENLMYYAGVDWGFAEGHNGSIVLLGDDPHTGITYLIKEITEIHKYIDWWKNRALELQEQYGDINFWCDSARPEYVGTFQEAGLNARNAKKAVMPGVEAVGKKITSDKFRVVKQGVRLFLDEIYQYTWNPITGEPFKRNDDVMDATRYAVYNQRSHDNIEFMSNDLF
ncbi:PBSX family phage terminase large subunit [Lactobacillus sp.]|uniref:PBSX family phage terminase large subunit n=1 Tax=Lactobacillus sp. TaxID=1591 RepID=UPI0019A35C62|nr:PBSX family phage terminase large subunit [Lactobacillus sp.]MBD5429335.1 PBSX family phage terminase large subunit [Lactobacillus sp.]MBD5430008.1 PBSX family phage terminase large subunit [Lactobacillus sp.]